MFALPANHIQQVGVLLDALSQLALDFLELGLLLLDVANALLLGLLVLELLIKHSLRRSTHLQRVQVYEVAESKHLAFFVLALFLVHDALVFVDFAAFLQLGVLVLGLLLLEVGDFDVELALAVYELEKLGARDQRGRGQVLGQEEPAPVLLG